MTGAQGWALMKWAEWRECSQSASIEVVKGYVSQEAEKIKRRKKK